MKKILQSTLAVVALLLAAVPVMATDILVKADAAAKTITLSSGLSQPVHVMGLVSDTTYFGTSADLPALGTVTVPFAGDPPTAVTTARCYPSDQGGITGYTPAPEGFFLVSATLQ